MTKELSMVENNKIGRISRKYFIAIDIAFLFMGVAVKSIDI